MSKNSYAIIRSSISGGMVAYGHVNISVYDVSDAIRGTLEIKAQYGGSLSKPFEAYAIQEGYRNGLRDTIGLSEMALALPILRRIEKKKAKLAETLGRPMKFAEEVVHFLTAAGVPVVYFLIEPNASYSNEKDLPSAHPASEPGKIVEAIQAMERKLQSRL